MDLDARDNILESKRVFRLAEVREKRFTPQQKCSETGRPVCEGTVELARNCLAMVSTREARNEYRPKLMTQ